MQPLIVLPGALRVALVIAAVAVAVLIIHLLTGSQRFEKRPGALTVICLVILCLGFAALFALSHGSPDPREIEGFEPFEASDTGSAAALVSDRARHGILRRRERRARRGLRHGAPL